MKELLDKIQYLGIPRREAEVYIALLHKKEFTAPEIAKVTSISRTKSYEILQNLVKKGLCNESFRNGIKVFSSTSPKIVFKNILSEYDRKKAIADELQVELTNLQTARPNNAESLDYIEILTEGEQIKERWLDLQDSTKKELLLFSKQPYALPLKENLVYEKSLLKRKVVYKCIYEYSGIKSLEDGQNLIKILEQYENIGEKIRIVEELPFKLCISDDSITLLALNDKISFKPSITSVFINHPSFSGALKKVFETVWSTGISLSDFKKNITKIIRN
jgi:sugar-specific transcriptional regulator TrmB